MSQAREIKFLVDATAARLSRWLRFLGHDAVLDKSDSDARLLVRAGREGRVLLTRKRNVAANVAENGSAGVLLLSSDFLQDQLEQVVSCFGLSPGPAPRCTQCNSELVPVSRAEAEVRVPEFVYLSRNEFAFCAHCDKYYWKGTHWDNAVREVSRALAQGRVRKQPCS
jgi:uncharacterized protein with PIN domain